MSRTFGGWASMAAAAALVAAPAWAAIAWQTVSDPAEKFTIELPGTASRTVTQTPLDSGGALPTVEHSASVDGGYYSISSTNSGMNPPADKIPAALSSSTDAMIAKDGGTVTWKRAVTVSGQPAVDAEYAMSRNGAPSRGRVLVTFANQRLYNIILRQPAAAPAATQERVVKSLRLTN